MLAIGRVLMARPRLALLDEPSMGLAPLVAGEILKQIRCLPEAGTTVLLVEQNARSALTIADRGYVIETGRVVLAGSADELKRDPRVQTAYLGRAARAAGAR
jgi:branched-chain amino acid transport system ATP-binding protein